MAAQVISTQPARELHRLHLADGRALLPGAATTLASAVPLPRLIGQPQAHARLRRVSQPSDETVPKT